jgi:hypothetical protein
MNERSRDQCAMNRLTVQDAQTRFSELIANLQPG